MSAKRFRLSTRFGDVVGYANTLAELEPMLFAHLGPFAQVFDLDTRMELGWSCLLNSLGYHSIGWMNDWDHKPDHPFNQAYCSVSDWHELMATIRGRHLSASPTLKAFYQCDSGD